MKLRYIICFFSCICIFTFTYYIGYGLLIHRPEQELSEAPSAQANPVPESHEVRAAQEPETEEASRQALPVQESPVPAEDSGAFFIREEDGMITVYESDRETVYLHTNIYTRLLPQRERERLAEGFFVPSEVELFDCLENYTS